MSIDEGNAIREAKRKYYREWRRKNPERVAKAQERFWKRKVAEICSQEPAATDSELLQKEE